MENVKNEDHLFEEKVKAITDEAMIEWMQKKSRQYMKIMAYYRCALMEIETKFNVLNQEYSLKHDRNPINAIKGRIKSVSSIQEKLKRKNLPVSLSAIEENINDVAGVRVICSFPEDVYALAEALLKQDDITLLARKDYIAHP